MRKLIGAALVAALALGACSDQGPDAGFEELPSQSESPTADASPAASAEATTAEVDVTTTPDEITPEWVTAVVNTLLAEYGEMTAEILAMPVQEDPELPEGYEERLADLFAGQYLDFAHSELAALLTDTEDRRSELLAADQFEGLRFDVQVVQIERDDCIVAVGRADRSGSVPGGGPAETLSAISLSPSQTEVATWSLRDVLVNTNSEGKPNPDEFMLDASLQDYGDALDHTCEVAA